MRWRQSCQGRSKNPVRELSRPGLYLALLCYTLCMKLALKITPQRSTQYANMTKMLAAQELLASPLGAIIAHIESATLAGQDYLLVNIDEVSLGVRIMEEPPSLPGMLDIFDRLATTSEVYEYFEHLG